MQGRHRTLLLTKLKYLLQNNSLREYYPRLVNLLRVQDIDFCAIDIVRHLLDDVGCVSVHSE